MADIYSQDKRSEIMSKISGKETKPEILVRKTLFANALRYRKNVKTLPGSPDIVLPKYKTVIFVHGCFWHGHTCKAAKLPETRNEFWSDKIASNLKRDSRNIEELQSLGWKVLIVWQCSIKNKTVIKSTLNEVIHQITLDH
jgi:DNA mismatch endonuclease (patch repair protein)